MNSRVLGILVVWAALAGAAYGFYSPSGAMAPPGAMKAGMFSPPGGAVSAPQANAVSPTFDLNLADGSGPDNLSSSLTVNGTAMTLAFHYRGQDAADTWVPVGGVGPTLTRTAGSTTLNRTPIFTQASARRVNVSANSVRYNSAGGADMTTGNIGASEDFVIEVLGCISETGAATYSVGKDNGGALTGAGGWWVGFTSILDVAIGDGTTSRALVSGAQAGACYHFIWFGDHDQATASQSCVGYLNGVGINCTGGLSAIGAIGGTAYSLTLGNLGAGNYGSINGGPIDVKMWKCTGCMAGGATNPTQWQAIASERLHRLAGTYADVAAGSAVPSSFTRSTSAWTDADLDDDGVRRLAAVGAGWPRTVRRVDSGGSTRYNGFLSEPASTNLILQSSTLGTTWALIDAGDSISANVGVAADGFSTMDGVIADATDGQHGVTQAITLTATTYTCSAYARAGTQGWAYASDDTVANATAYFDLSPCDEGTLGAGSSRSLAESWSADLCRVEWTFTGTAAAHTVRLGCAAADGDNTFAGNGSSVACQFGKVQCEAHGGATSHIETTTATVTRNADVLLTAAGANMPTSIGLGTQAVSFIQQGWGVGAVRDPFLVIDPGAASGIGMVVTNSNRVRFIGYNSGLQWSIDASSGAPNDGAHHSIWQTFQANDVKAYFDGTLVGTDTSATIAATGTSLNVASTWTSSYSYTVPTVITRIRHYPAIVASVP